MCESYIERNIELSNLKSYIYSSLLLSENEKDITSIDNKIKMIFNNQCEIPKSSTIVPVSLLNLFLPTKIDTNESSYKICTEIKSKYFPKCYFIKDRLPLSFIC